jgi:hypothetical protein
LPLLHLSLCPLMMTTTATMMTIGTTNNHRDRQTTR